MNTLFTHLSSARMASAIRAAKERVCYVAPGIQMVTAQAVAGLTERIPPDELIVSLDFDESTLRMGYGDLEAVRLLADAGIAARNSPGLRCAFLIVDSAGWVFTPTALYMESEPQSDETPNALALAPEQISEILVRVSSVARSQAVRRARTAEEKADVEIKAMEIGVTTIDDDRLAQVSEAIRQAPPVAFDVARQVRVFQPYLQYVELEFAGAKIQRHRTTIPRSIQTLGSGKDLEGKLRTTFQLIGSASELSSAKLDEEIEQLRKHFTRSLGKQQRVILKSARAVFDKRIEAFREKLEKHRTAVKADLQKELDRSRKEAVDYYFALAKANLPDALLGQLLTPSPTDDDIRRWLDDELNRTFPTAEKLVTDMQLDLRFKDVTFETLDQPDFLQSLKAAYSGIDLVVILAPLAFVAGSRGFAHGLSLGAGELNGAPRHAFADHRFDRPVFVLGNPLKNAETIAGQFDLQDRGGRNFIKRRFFFSNRFEARIVLPPPMLPDRTLLILGAGASRPYLFPTGKELTNLLLEREENTELLESMGFSTQLFHDGEHLWIDSPENVTRQYRHWLESLLKDCGIEAEAIKQFQERFYLSQAYSVDAFVADNPSYAPLASLMVAAIILRCEREENLNGDWYQLLLNELVDQHGKGFPAATLSVITFNYDRSLEMYLYRAFKNRYDLTSGAAWHLASRVEIVHVYGSLGTLYNTEGGRELGYGVQSQAIDVVSRNLRLVGPGSQSQHTSSIQFLLNRSPRIVFLGFGFDRLNLEQKRLILTARKYSPRAEV